MSDSKCFKCRNGVIFGDISVPFDYKICDCEIGAFVKSQGEHRIKWLREEEIENRKKNDAAIVENFGSIYLNAKITDFENNERKAKLLSDMKTDVWIYLHGESRGGKTHLAAALSRLIFGTIIKSVSLDIMISAYGNENRMAKIDALAKANVLYIDDLGVGKLTQERHSMYYYIIDYRISNGLKTIITSNYKTDNLWRGSTDIDPTRIIKRIQEASHGYELEKRVII